MGGWWEKRVADVLNCQGNGSDPPSPIGICVNTSSSHSPRVGRRNALVRQMHSSRRQRYREVVDDISETLLGISFEPRLMPSPAIDPRTIRSSASTPSLRSRDGTVPLHARMDNGGNVRVVVRVRAFLPRGISGSHLAPRWCCEADRLLTVVATMSRDGAWG